MGLDMYLEEAVYIGAEYEHNGITGTIDITASTGTERERKIDIDLSRVTEILLRVASWRKANQIHHWITKDWDDDTQGEISGEKLMELVNVCKKIIVSLEKQTKVDIEMQDYWDNKKTITVNTWPNTDLALELLPPQEGFFFGTYIIDDWYLANLKDTVEMLDGKVDENTYYKYTGSY